MVVWFFFVDHAQNNMASYLLSESQELLVHYIALSYQHGLVLAHSMDSGQIYSFIVNNYYCQANIAAYCSWMAAT